MEVERTDCRNLCEAGPTPSCGFCTTTVIAFPRTLVSGAGCIHACAGALALAGARRAMIITTPPLLSASHSLKAELAQEGIEALVHDGIDHEPSCRTLNTVCALQQEFHADTVIGLGGGSVMDVAKFASAMAGAETPVEEIVRSGTVARRGLRLVCVPTTAGTGSEASPNAIFIDGTAKRAVISPLLVPDTVYLDPELTVSLPVNVTGPTAMDALTHCIEAYLNVRAHPVVDVYALEGIRLIMTALPRALRDGHDLEARSMLLMGSFYGGLCLGPVNTAAVHALAYPLGGLYKVPHGVSNAVLLAPVMEFNRPVATERLARMSTVLNGPASVSTDEQAACILEQVRQLTRLCGLDGGLQDLGIPREDIPKLAESAMTITRLLVNNPREVTFEDAVRIYEAAWNAPA